MILIYNLKLFNLLYMKNEYQYCALCEKEIKPVYDDDTFETENLEANSWSGGIVDTIFAGYGSSNDGNTYLITICDHCLENNKNIKKIKTIFD